MQAIVHGESPTSPTVGALHGEMTPVVPITNKPVVQPTDVVGVHPSLLHDAALVPGVITNQGTLFDLFLFEEWFLIVLLYMYPSGGRPQHLHHTSNSYNDFFI